MKLQKGDRVELLDRFMNAPFQGHTGTVLKRGKLGRFWHVKLDMPGMLGQTMARVRASGLQKIPQT